MRSREALLGHAVPGNSWLHRLPAGWTWLLMFVPALVALLAGRWQVSAGVAVFAAVALLSAGIPPRIALWPGWAFTVLVALVVGYQVAWGSLTAAGVVGANLVGCLWLARMLTLTTPVSDLIDAASRAAHPLARIGFPAERFGLAIGLMVRSVPHIMGAFEDVRDAARARGLERNWFARITPVLVLTVAYAERTGEALVARGLGDDDAVDASDEA